jgi:hypothetical protein
LLERSGGYFAPGFSSSSILAVFPAKKEFMDYEVFGLSIIPSSTR